MPGAPIADRQGRRGGKHPLWVSGADWAKLEDLSSARGEKVTAGEVFRHGLAHISDPVAAPPDMEPALELVSRLAAALARGGRVTYGEDYPGVPSGYLVLSPPAVAALDLLVTSGFIPETGESAAARDKLRETLLAAGARTTWQPGEGLAEVSWAPYVEFGTPDPADEQHLAPSGPVMVMSVGYKGDGNITVYWKRPSDQEIVQHVIDMVAARWPGEAGIGDLVTGYLAGLADEAGDVNPDQADARVAEAAARLLRKYFHPSRRGGQVPSEGLGEQVLLAETLLDYVARQARGSTDDPPAALSVVRDQGSGVSFGGATEP